MALALLSPMATAQSRDKLVQSTFPLLTISNIKGLKADDCYSAYGKLIGTFLVCSFFEMGMSFIPAKKLQKLFPPLVTGLTVILIGTSLVGKSGFLNWGGGTNDCQLRPAAPSIFALCPTSNAPNALP